MNTTPLSLAIAGVLAAAATGAAAQTTYGQAYSTYQQQMTAYQQQQQAYAQAQAKYEQERATYDARYGYGAYARRYGAFSYTPSTYGYGYGGAYPTTPSAPIPYGPYPYSSAPSTYGSGYATTYPYGYGTTSPYGYGTTPYTYGTTAPYAGAYGANAAYTGVNPCVNAGSSSSVNLGVLSALAQAALGGGASTSSVVNQAVLGAAVTSALGSRTTAGVKCDTNGVYYSYSQTQPYREGYYDASGRWHATTTSAAYARCRIAPAPTNAYGSEYRYVRVCPDASGRYRITA